MEINFQKKGASWVAEFSAAKDFNLHIEGVADGSVMVYQRGTENGEYAYVRGATPSSSFSKTYDYDFTALVYPKYIKVVTDVEPTKSVVTFSE